VDGKQRKESGLVKNSRYPKAFNRRDYNFSSKRREKKKKRGKKKREKHTYERSRTTGLFFQHEGATD